MPKLNDLLITGNKAPAVNAAGASKYNPFAKLAEDYGMMNKTSDFLMSETGVNNSPFKGDWESYSEYNVPINPIDTEEELNRQRANNQSFGEQLFNSLAQTVGDQIVLGTLEGFVNIADAIAGNPGGDYQNTASAAIAKWREDFRDQFAIYEKDPNKSFAFGDWGWWFNNLPSVASSISLMIPSGMIAKGIGLLGKAITATKYANKIRNAVLATKLGNSVNFIKGVKAGKEAIGILGQAAISRVGENYMESRDTYNNVIVNAENAFDNMTDAQFNEFIKNNPEFEGKDKKEIARILAGESADEVFKKDMGLMLFDAMQLKALKYLWRGNSQSSPLNAALREHQRKAISAITGKSYEPLKGYNKFIDFIKNRNYKIIATEASEGVEEMWQYVAQTKAIDDVKNKLDPSQKVRSHLDYLKDAEAWEAGFWGWLGGIAFQGLGDAVTYGYNKYQDNKEKKNNPNAGEFNMKRAQGVLDSYRAAEIDSRVAAFNTFNERMKLTNEGKDVNRPITNIDGELVRDENGDIMYEDLPEGGVEYAKESIRNEFLTNLTINAKNAGNYDSLVEFVKATELGQDADFTNKALADMEYISTMYDVELNNVMQNTTSPQIAKQIAVDNVTHRLTAERANREANEYTNTYNQTLSSIRETNNELANSTDLLARSVENAYIEEEINATEENINKLEESYKNGEINRTQYLETLRHYNTIKDALTKYRDKLTFTDSPRIAGTSEELFTQLLNINEQLALAKRSEVNAKELAAISRESVLVTKDKIKEKVNHVNAINEAFRKNEFENALKDIKDIIESESIDNKDVIEYLNGRPNNLSDAVKQKLETAIEKYDLFSYDNSRVNDFITATLRKESQTPSTTTNGINTDGVGIPTPPHPDSQLEEDPLEGGYNTGTDITTSSSSPTGEQQGTTPVKEVDEIDGNAVVVSKPDESDLDLTEDERNYFRSEAEAGRSELDQENELAKERNKLIAANNIDYYKNPNFNYAAEKEKVRKELEKVSPSPILTNHVMNEYQSALIDYIFRDMTFEEAIQLPFIRDIYTGLDSAINFYANRLVNAIDNNIDTFIEAIINQYIKTHNIVGSDQKRYVNIDSIMRDIISSGITDYNKLKNIYNKLINYFTTNPKSKFKLVGGIPEPISDAKITSLIKDVNNALESNLNADSFITTPTNDKRVKIYSNKSLKPNQPLYLRIGYSGNSRSKGINGIEIYERDDKGRYVKIGFNSKGTRTSDGDGYIFNSRSFPYAIYKKNGTYESIFDELFNELFGYTITENGIINNPKKPEQIEFYNAILDLVTLRKLNPDTNVNLNYINTNRFTKEEIDKDIAIIMNNDIVKRIFGENNPVNVESLINIIAPIINYNNISDNNFVRYNSYKNFLARQYFNLAFVDEVIDRINRESTNDNDAYVEVQVASSSFGEAIESDTPSYIDQAVVNYSNTVSGSKEIGNTELCCNYQKGKIKFANGTEYNLEGFQSEGSGVMVAISNGSNQPTYRPIFGDTLDFSNKNGLAYNIKEEVVNLLVSYQNGNISFDDLSNKLHDIIKYDSLVQGFVISKSGDRIIISNYKNVGNKLADITIYKRDKNGNDNTGISFFELGDKPENDTVTSSSKFPRKTLDEKISKILSNGKFNISRNYYLEGTDIKTNYVSHDANGEFKITINGKTFSGKNYLDFIVKNKLGKIYLGKANINGINTNFMPTTSTGNQAANRNVQVMFTPKAGDNATTVVTAKVNSLFNRAEEEYKKQNRLTVKASSIIEQFAPHFSNIVNLKFGNNKLIKQDTEFELVLAKEDNEGINADASYDIKNNKFIIYRRAFETLVNNPNNIGERELVRMIIHERVHQLIRTNNTAIDINAIQNDTLVIAKLLYDKINNNTTELENYATNNNIDIIKLKRRINIILNTYLNDNHIAFKENKDNDNIETNRACEEFIVEMLTRPELINLANNLTSDLEFNNNDKPKSIWQKFIELIGKIFFGKKYDVKDNSILNAQIRVLSNQLIINSNNSEITDKTVPNTKINVSTPVGEELANTELKTPVSDSNPEPTDITNSEPKTDNIETKEEPNPKPTTVEFVDNDFTFENYDESSDFDSNDDITLDTNINFYNVDANVNPDGINRIGNLSNLQQAINPEQQAEFALSFERGEVWMVC